MIDCMFDIERRKFITLLGDAVAWPFVAHAQQPLLPVIGFLSSLGKGDRPNLREGFRRGLSESGYVEGHNVSIEYRFAENQHDRLPALAAELVDRKVAVIAATGGGGSILAAKAATTTIPIVFTYGGDPVREGFVASLNRPGGNVTGASFFSVSSAWHLHQPHSQGREARRSAACRWKSSRREAQPGAAQPDRSAGGKGAVGLGTEKVALRANFFSLRRQQAYYDRDLLGLLDQQFYQGKPATNQFEFVIVQSPGLSSLSILCLRDHGTLLLCRSGSTFPFTQC